MYDHLNDRYTFRAQQVVSIYFLVIARLKERTWSSTLESANLSVDSRSSQGLIVSFASSGIVRLRPCTLEHSFPSRGSHKRRCLLHPVYGTIHVVLAGTSEKRHVREIILVCHRRRARETTQATRLGGGLPNARGTAEFPFSAYAL